MLETGAKIGFIVLVIIALLSTGTVLFSNLEHWSFVDSFYFTAMTLTTIGYGDLVPTTDASKIVTVVFALSGVATFLYALSVIAMAYIPRGIERGQQFEEVELRRIKDLLGRLDPFRRRKGIPR